MIRSERDKKVASLCSFVFTILQVTPLLVKSWTLSARRASKPRSARQRLRRYTGSLLGNASIRDGLFEWRFDYKPHDYCKLHGFKRLELQKAVSILAFPNISPRLRSPRAEYGLPAIIFLAVAGPTPGSRSSSASVAVFKSIFSLTAGLALSELDECLPFASCAMTDRPARQQRIITANRNFISPRMMTNDDICDASLGRDA